MSRRRPQRRARQKTALWARVGHVVVLLGLLAIGAWALWQGDLGAAVAAIVGSGLLARR